MLYFGSVFGICVFKTIRLLQEFGIQSTLIDVSGWRCLKSRIWHSDGVSCLLLISAILVRAEASKKGVIRLRDKSVYHDGVFMIAMPICVGVTLTLFLRSNKGFSHCSGIGSTFCFELIQSV